MPILPTFHTARGAPVRGWRVRAASLGHLNCPSTTFGLTTFGLGAESGDRIVTVLNLGGFLSFLWGYVRMVGTLPLNFYHVCE